MLSSKQALQQALIKCEEEHAKNKVYTQSTQPVQYSSMHQILDEVRKETAEKPPEAPKARLVPDGCAPVVSHVKYDPVVADLMKIEDQRVLDWIDEAAAQAQKTNALFQEAANIEAETDITAGNAETEYKLAPLPPTPQDYS